MGTLGQDHFRFDDRTPIDVVRMGRPLLWQALEERAGLLLEVVGGGAAHQGERLAGVTTDFDHTRHGIARGEHAAEARGHEQIVDLDVGIDGQIR